MPITMTFTDEEIDGLKGALNAGWLHYAQRAKACDDKYMREGNEQMACEAGQLWSRVYRAEQDAKAAAVAPPSPLLVLCDNCQSEGRILTCDGGPDEEDHGCCPICEGNGQLLVDGEPIDMDDLESMGGPLCKR